MKRSLLAALAGLAAAVLAAPASAAAAAPKTNFLFLIADDLNCELGTYGAKHMKTPAIDALAARGVRFDRAYCQFPLGSPSRSSMLTGRRPNANGVLTNPGQGNPYAAHFRNTIPDTVTLPQLFKQGGWHSVRVGKLYHYGVPNDIGTSSLDDYASWDRVVNPRGRDRELHDKIFSLRPGQFGGTLSWLRDDEGEDAEHTDGIGAAEAIELLEKFKREARPFFLAVGFYRPHTPYVAPKKYFDLYPRESIELPALSADDRARTIKPAYASTTAPHDNATDEQKRDAIQAYRASISFLDAQVGRVVAALDRLGLADNTVIVFTSDHGYHLGDHGLWMKQSLFERSARVPLIIAPPAAKAKGGAARGVVELVDLYPTLAAFAGLKSPAYVDGVDLRPMLDNPQAEVKPAAYSQVRRGANLDGFSVRTTRWRYTEFGAAGASGRLLHDLEADPAEANNLAADPAHAATVAELSALLAAQRARK